MFLSTNIYDLYMNEKKSLALEASTLTAPASGGSSANVPGAA